MNDAYKELLVKTPMGIKEKLLRIVCLVPTIVAGFFALVTGSILLFIITVGLGVLTYFVFQWTDIEYEYVYFDKEITVDKIMAKARRKKVCEISIDKMEMLAPQKSYHLDSYRNRQVTVKDLSAKEDLPEQKLYELYYEGNTKYILNLTEDFVKPIKSVAPRKTFTD